MENQARARRLKREHGLELIVVDYLQLMQVPGTTENRATEISTISRSLKALARELEVPIIALSQLNRSVEQRTEKKPMMSDLRESGAIEQDADVIVFIYREEVYDSETPRKGIADINVAKQRNGPVGDFQLTFLGQVHALRELRAGNRGLRMTLRAVARNRYSGALPPTSNRVHGVAARLSGARRRQSRCLRARSASRSRER